HQGRGDGDHDRDDRDRGRGRGHFDFVCAYHGSAAPNVSPPTRNPAHYGVPVVDITDPNHLVTTGFLQSTSMLDPWESLKVNERRQLLGADNGQNGGGGPRSISTISPRIAASRSCSPPCRSAPGPMVASCTRSSGMKVHGRPTG